MSKLLKGIGMLNEIHELINYFRFKKILLVTGKSSYILSGARKIIDENLSSKVLIHFVWCNLNCADGCCFTIRFALSA